MENSINGGGQNQRGGVGIVWKLQLMGVGLSGGGAGFVQSCKYMDFKKYSKLVCLLHLRSKFP